MRFIVHELPYEQPIAAGRYVYRRQDQPTGAMESWRLTAAVDGYKILRVDLDAREAESGDSYLYHLTLNPAGQPERLNFRFFRPGLQIRGNVLFEPGRVTLSREINGEREDGEAPFPAGTLFWFPATAGLSLVGGCQGASQELPAVMLDREVQFDLRPVTITLATGVPEMVLVRGEPVETQPVSLVWLDQERHLWLDEYCWPVQMRREDLQAVTERYARY